MADTGFKFPSSVTTVSRASADDWNDASNALAADSTVAYNSPNSGGGSYYIRLYNFDFSTVPDSAVIMGVEAELWARELGAGTIDIKLQLLDSSGGPFGTAKTFLLNGQGIKTEGGSSDSWGATLSPATVKDPDFGIQLWYEEDHDVDLDYISLKIYYSENDGSLPDGFKVGDTVVGEKVSDSAVSDGLKVGDTEAADVAASVTGADGIKAGDTAAATVSAEASVTEGVKAGDTLAGATGADQTVSEGIKAGDANAGAATVDRSVSDGIKAGDTESAGAVTDQTVTEGIKAGDTEAQGADVPASVSEGVKVGDAADATRTQDAAASEGIKAGDASSATASAAAAQTEGIKVGDTAAAATDAASSISEGIKMSDGTDAVSGPEGDNRDTILVGDTVQSSVTTGFRPYCFVVG